MLKIADREVKLKTGNLKYIRITGNIILNWNYFVGCCLD